MDFHKGSLFVATLRSRSLLKIDLDNLNVEHWFSDAPYEGHYGRLRDVVSHDDHLYVATSNHDGRGDPDDGDDKILKLRI